MHKAFVLSALLISLSFSTFAAEPAKKGKVIRTLTTKNGKKIRTKNGQIVQVKQSGFHKSLG
jgi:hypothetical protein